MSPPTLLSLLCATIRLLLDDRQDRRLYLALQAIGEAQAAPSYVRVLAWELFAPAALAARGPQAAALVTERLRQIAELLAVASARLEAPCAPTLGWALVVAAQPSPLPLAVAGALVPAELLHLQGERAQAELAEMRVIAREALDGPAPPESGPRATEVRT